MILLSGGAEGADRMFMVCSESLQHKVINYYYGETSKYNAPYGNTHITNEDYEEGRVMAALAAKMNWGYKYPKMKDSRLIRNWSQVKHTQTIIAVSNIVNTGEKVFPNVENDPRTALIPCVTGGTGYAVGMAILIKKPVYVHSMKHNKWCMWDYDHNTFVICEVPKLEPEVNTFTGIGSRELTEQGIKAILEFYENNF